MYGVTTPLASFCALIARHVPDCPEFLKEREVIRAVADFCKSSRSWRTTVEAHVLSADDSWIDANALATALSANALAYAVDDVFLAEGKTPLQRLSTEEMDRKVPGWMGHTAKTPTGFMVYPDRRVRIYPAMASDAENVTVDVELILIPGPNITLLPDYIFNFHQDAVIHMAVFRLMTLAGMPFTDPEKAQFHLASALSETEEGNNELAKQAVDAVNGRTRRQFYR